MKKMLKLLIVVIVFTIATASYAQTFGVKAGLNLSNMLVKDDNGMYSDDFKMNPGFHVGATAEFPITELLSFETGLLFSTKGYKASQTWPGGAQLWNSGGARTALSIIGPASLDVKMNLFYLDIPLTAKATVDLGGAKIYGVFGPYIGIGLSGKVKSEWTSAGQTTTEEEDIKWGSGDDDDYKRLDFGLTMGAGVEISSIELGVFYGLGLANIAANTDRGSKANNRVLSVSVGYKFRGK